MQSRSIKDYIALGFVLWYLKDAGLNYTNVLWRVHGDAFVLDNINLFFRYLEDFNLPVTLRAAKKLKILRGEFAQKDIDHVLTAGETSRLRDIMEDLRKIILAEAEEKMTFSVTEKRVDVNKLLSNISSLMAPKVFKSLPAIAQYDFKEAGKCIAFERPTAAAFHLLRGTEAVLRHFYCFFVKRKRVKNLLWGPMIQDLRKRRKKPPDVLLNYLDNIRHSFRNPTQHPDKIYNIERYRIYLVCASMWSTE